MSEPTIGLPRKKSKRGQRIISVGVIAVLVLGLAGFGAWSFYNYQQAEKEVIRLSTLEGQQDLQQREVDELLSAVARHLVLPEDEQPTIATVTDVGALTENQPFFEGASNGDKVIVYTGARKAIIYSPERDVVVNVGTVVVDNNEVALEDVEEAVLSDKDSSENSTESSELQE